MENITILLPVSSRVPAFKPDSANYTTDTNSPHLNSYSLKIPSNSSSKPISAQKAQQLIIGTHDQCQLMKLKHISSATLLIASLALFPVIVSAQANQNLSQRELTKQIARMDSALFRAFNNCDVTTSKSLFTEDLEFYHDNGGLTNYEQNVRSIIQRCSRQTKVRRELVKGSIEVYPIKDFGAIQIGSHRFYYTEPGKAEQLDGTFKFVHIWKNVNGAWKISRVISYDH